MELYSAVVTTTPFLVIAFLLELRVLGPVAHRRRRRQRRVDRATDQHAVLLLAVGFTAALLGLLLELDHWALRTLAAVPLGVAGAVLFAAVRADLDTRYDTPDWPAPTMTGHPDPAARRAPPLCPWTTGRGTGGAAPSGTLKDVPAPADGVAVVAVIRSVPYRQGLVEGAVMATMQTRPPVEETVTVTDADTISDDRHLGGPLRPTLSEVEGAGELLHRIDALIGNHRHGLLVGPDGDQVAIPASALEALRQVAVAMANGQAVTVAPHDLELTTQEAADLLHVSRPHLIKLLDRGDLPHHRTSEEPGAHRRVLLKDVTAYRDRRRRTRREQLRELTRASQQLGGGYR